MKTRVIFNMFTIVIFLGIIGCGDKDKDLKKDTDEIADIMCKRLGVMHKIRITDPSDSIQTMKLQTDEQRLQGEMNVIYQQFNTKYGDRVKKPDFVKKFRKNLSAAMLKCKNISQEDREGFEKDVNN